MTHSLDFNHSPTTTKIIEAHLQKEIPLGEDQWKTLVQNQRELGSYVFVIPYATPRLA